MFSANPVISTLSALGITLGLIWLAAKSVSFLPGKLSATLRMTMRRGGITGVKLLGTKLLPASSHSAMFTVESVTAIAPRRKVIVLRYGEQRLAVMTGGPQDLSLGWLPPP